MLKAVTHQSARAPFDSPSPVKSHPPRFMSIIKPPASLHRPSASDSNVQILRQQLSIFELRMQLPAAEHRQSMAAHPPSTPKRHPSSIRRPQSSIWPGEIPPRTPVKSISPKEYLTAISNLVSFSSKIMGDANLPAMIWAFNHAHARKDRTAMRNLATSMLPTLQLVHVAYHEFCAKRETFDAEDIWNMVIGLGEDGSKFWDVVDELGDLVDIMEGEDTVAFWKSMDSVLKGRRSPHQSCFCGYPGDLSQDCEQHATCRQVPSTADYIWENMPHFGRVASTASYSDIDLGREGLGDCGGGKRQLTLWNDVMHG